MLSQIIYSAIFKGTSFVGTNGKTYVLLNGQSISRSNYSDLSAIWPDGAYGSTPTNIHTPPTNGIYFRGYDFGSGRDVDAASRIPLSGTLPTTNTVGAYQTANLQSHVHALGTQGGSGPCADGGGQDGGSTSYTPLTGKTSTGMSITNNANSSVVGSGTLSSNFDVSHTIVYAYIAVV